jgi:hypothetical protein
MAPPVGRPKRTPASRATVAQQAPSAKKKKKGKQPAADKVAVPDVVTVIDSFNTSEENSVLFAAAVQSVHDWTGEAMGPQAWEWLASNLSVVMQLIKANVRSDPGKRAQFDKLIGDLTKSGWQEKTAGCFAEWSFFLDATTSATKINKAVKAAAMAASYFLGAAHEEELNELGGGVGLGGGDGLGGGSESEDEGTYARRPANPARGTREEDELPFFPTDLMADDLASPPPFVRQVTNRSLRADEGLNQRANAFGLGAFQPAHHQQATGENLGFNMTFGCATTDYREARILQENKRTGGIMSVAVGAPKTYVGLLSLYNKEIVRLENAPDVNGIPH